MNADLDSMDEKKNDKTEVWNGIALTALLHLTQLLFFWMQFMPAFLIGLSQLVYIIPAIIYFQSKGRPGMVQGLVIGAAVTFLINAACFGYVLTNLGH